MQAHTTDQNSEQLHFWALGDLHFRALAPWREFQAQRYALMFEDLQALWQAEGAPAFCVSPGDIIETCAQENYDLAKSTLQTYLGQIPFYPGIGNHEYHEPEIDPRSTRRYFTAAWDKPPRYTWQAEGLLFIMLDYPDPLTLADPTKVFISQETQAFLEESLAAHPNLPALIFLHCPLRNTVLDRNPALGRDYNSLQSFFSPENSQEIRNILSRHRNASLFFSGHTHSGWEAPRLVVSERDGDHFVSFVNLMSPWYTGTHKGPHVDKALTSFSYSYDDPDIIPTFSIRTYANYASIRVRDHKSRSWLKTWHVPLFSH
ncbi:metallophosphoesterase family protein [Tengunoibacter tsumagoiensis]|uniref:Calcineurin-like phosphoesterase domain-containing protein n=1 Tax=Tengunoibacter tsumagoiensis TaxID=2014871 RepID=A0A401ZUF8_9CHLR|nr:metallophosphoesterase [Tengunoibacter tsumagoiensis]GCE10521.1 hypothetical protein KTT_03800 [Tengunoibacter tsumagoiensis]